MYVTMLNMKTCTRCKETKDLSLFHRNSSQKSGYAPHCKQCHKRAYPIRSWNMTDKGMNSAKIATKAWAERNRIKVNTYAKVRYHLSKGHIVKPDNCQQCNSINKLDAHHHDYSKPLDVEWLCRQCHKNAHL